MESVPNMIVAFVQSCTWKYEAFIYLDIYPVWSQPGWRSVEVHCSQQVDPQAAAISRRRQPLSWLAVASHYIRLAVASQPQFPLATAAG